MAGILTLESSLNFIFHCPKIIVRKILNFLRCVGKKTAQFDKLIASLLQAEASACVSGFVSKAFRMQFCAWAVHYFVFFFLSLSSKLSVRFCRTYTDGQRLSVAAVRGFEAIHCLPALNFDRCQRLRV